MTTEVVEAVTPERFRRLSWAWLTYKRRNASWFRVDDIRAERARRQKLEDAAK